ncbi:D-sedoheptulose-7-phosphate isomerase [Micromonospora sp. DT233]|uniref:D-sedoheptulose-7-phosphate isomerase n=1 Tax=Micromonospora sp. DT233 TaxID=3393432 RepID=UPI003CEED735
MAAVPARPDGGAAPSVLDAHLAHLAAALPSLRGCEELLARWGAELAHRLAAGGRLLVAGNGGSAAEAQHLTAELVGKLRDDREPLSAIALHAETSALTAIGNDYGYAEVFARQVRAHGRPGDILLLLTTSGTSANLLAAADAGRRAGLRCWAFTGPAPNPLADACHDTLAVASADGQVVQELHLLCAHVLCEYVDRVLPAARAAAGPATVGPAGATVGAVGAPAGPVRAGVEVALDGGADRPGGAEPVGADPVEVALDGGTDRPVEAGRGGE